MTNPNGLILVVDDEPIIVDLAVRCLGLRGYRALGAVNASEAIRLFHQHFHDIKLVITDVVMPDLFGDQLFTRFRELNPLVCVLYMSGNLPDALEADVVLEEGINFLSKPFSLGSLIAAVENSLQPCLRASSSASSEPITN